MEHSAKFRDLPNRVVVKFLIGWFRAQVWSEPDILFEDGSRFDRRGKNIFIRTQELGYIGLIFFFICLHRRKSCMLREYNVSTS